MKNLITAVGCTLLLMAVLLQFVQSQNTALRLAAVDNAVNSFRETVRQEGCVSEENEDDLKEELSGILDCCREFWIVNRPIFSWTETESQRNAVPSLCTK